jgi:hypothetical protein
MLLEILTRIKKNIATWAPHMGINSVPVAMAPIAAPVKSAAKQVEAGFFSSPIILAARGN